MKKNRKFSKKEYRPEADYSEEGMRKRAEQMVKGGWPSVEFALDMLRKGKELAPIARAKQDDFDAHATEEQCARAKAFQDRCMLSFIDY